MPARKKFENIPFEHTVYKNILLDPAGNQSLPISTKVFIQPEESTLQLGKLNISPGSCFGVSIEILHA